VVGLGGSGWQAGLGGFVTRDQFLGLLAGFAAGISRQRPGTAQTAVTAVAVREIRV
jgi:hypothetical protein